jgi:hypothetical protein
VNEQTPSQDCPDCGKFVQDRPNYGLHCECGWEKLRGGVGRSWILEIGPEWGTDGHELADLDLGGNVTDDDWEWAAKLAKTMREGYGPHFADDHRSPAYRSPDALHAYAREQQCTTAARWNGMDRACSDYGAYGIEPGDVVAYDNRLWDVVDVVRWPKGNGHTLRLHTLGGDHGIFAPVPWGGYRSPTVALLNGPHYPTCNDCGELWPCSDAREADDAAAQAAKAVARFEHEAENPHGCQHCGRRFTSKGGKANHERYCGSNPDRAEHPQRGKRRGSRNGYRLNQRGYIVFDD